MHSVDKNDSKEIYKRLCEINSVLFYFLFSKEYIYIWINNNGINVSPQNMDNNIIHSVLEWFLKDMNLKTGETAAENSEEYITS